MADSKKSALPVLVTPLLTDFTDYVQGLSNGRYDNAALLSLIESNFDPASMKATYEANADTNAFTDAEKVKLSGLTPGQQGIQQSYVLSENLSAGQPVALNVTSGEVEAISIPASSLGTPQIAVNAGDSISSLNVYDPVNDAFIIIQKATGGAQGVAIRADRSGTNLSFGTPTNLSGITSLGEHGAAGYDSVNGASLIIVESAVAGDFSLFLLDMDGGGIAGNTSVLATIPGVKWFQDIAYDPSLGVFIALYTNFSNDLKARVITINSKTSLSLGAEQNIVSAFHNSPKRAGVTFNTANNNYYMHYSAATNGDPSQPVVAKIIRSGNTLTLGTPAALPYTGTATSVVFNCYITYDGNTDRMIAVMSGATKAGGGTNRAIRGWTISVDGLGDPVSGAETSIFTDSTTFANTLVGHGLRIDRVSNKAVLYWYSGTNDRYYYNTLTPNAGAETLTVDANIDIFGASVGDVTSGSFYGISAGGEDAGIFLFTKITALSSSHAVFIAGGASNRDNFIGIMNEAGLATESKIVNLKGGIDFNQSGLTPLASYYIDDSGTITPNQAGTAFIGIAYNSTTLVLAHDKVRFEASEEAKLASIEAGATADQTGPEIKSLYEGEADTNAFTDADQAKLSGLSNQVRAAQSYTDPADFTAGVTTSLPLPADPGAEENLDVYFNGLFQDSTEWSITTGGSPTVNFNASIPVGVTKIEIRVFN